MAKNNYLNNKDLLADVLESKKQGKMTDILAHKLMLICQKYAKRSNWANYSYNDDMQGYAMLMLVKTWHKFNEEKSKNPFAFYTQCITNSFIQYLNKEKRLRNIRDELLLEQGMNPSYTYQEEYKSKEKIEKDNHHSNEKDDVHLNFLMY